jgi:ferric enterobactin receptor
LVSYIGYETRWIKLTPIWVEEQRPIELSQNRSILPIAAIYGEPSRMIQIEPWAGRNTLNVGAMRQLPQFGGYDAIRSIQLLPGVVGTNESSSEFQVRGGMSDENLVTFDDYTLYHLDHFFGIFSAFNGNSIKNIRVHKGWFPASFGGRTSSLVQITGKDGDKDMTRVTADLNFFSANLLLESPLYEDKVTFVLAGRRSFTDFIVSPAYQSLFTGLYNQSITQPGTQAVNPFDVGVDPKFHFYDVTSKLSFRPHPGEVVQLSFYSGRDDLNMSYPVAFQNGANIIYEDESQWGNDGGSIRWNKRWNDQCNTALVTSHSNYKSRLNALDQIDNIELQTVDSIFSNQLMRLQETAVKFESRLFVSGQKITMGAKLLGNEISLTDEDSKGMSSTRSEASLSTSVYIQDELEIAENIEANVGARFTYYRGTRIVYFEPRIAVDWAVHDHFSLKANFGHFAQTVRRIRPQNLFLNSPDLWRLSGFDHVPVLQTKYVSFGGLFTKGQLNIDVEGYYKTSTGLIVDPGLHQIFEENIYDNFWTATGEAFGADLMIQKTTGSHSGWVTFSTARSQMLVADLGYEAPVSGINAYESKWVYMYKRPRWNAAATFVYGSGKPFTPVLGTFSFEHANGNTQTYPAIGQINSARLPEYHKLDLSLTYSFQLAMSNASVSLAVFNVYNRDNIKQRQYFTVLGSNDDQIGIRDVSMMGLLPTLQFRITY